MESVDESRANIDHNDSEWDQIDHEDPFEDVELLELSESQLREEYDNEEIERFLALFASDVNEVQTPVTHKNNPPAIDRNGSNHDTSYNSYSEELALVRIMQVLPYPTAIELKERQMRVDEAKEIGDEFSARLVSGSLSTFDVQDMWRLFKVVAKPNKSKAKKETKRKDKGKEKEKDDEDDVVMGESSGPATESHKTRDERDLARFGLQFMNAVADIHERVHNIFIWRRPQASFRYGIFIFVCLLLVLLLPAQYISKLVYLILGVLFWHVAPVIAALPSEDRARLPPPLADIPTDADYAMELIAQRINAGMPVRPARKRHRRARARSVKTEDDTAPTSPPLTPEPGESSRPEKKIDWAKWGGRAARGKAWAVDKRLGGGKKEWPQESNTPRSPLVPPPATALGRPHTPVDSHTYPCQHTSAPGLITLSPAMFYFTPIMSPHPTLSFPINYLKGVKKSGMLKGVTLKWSDPDDGDKEREETFLWVGGRDELFARLIGANHQKWIRT
ncbi:hypothetical protein PQX77_007264 [Marasmius sp. AFHP31]|nr:hypothetical protein PQX77_007264 [Marasmius sp. AFHP31]